MSAVVMLPNRGQVEVPAGNAYTIDNDGKLHIRTSDYGARIAVFKNWDHVVIDPQTIRGPDGRFVKRG